jgi:uncharacterized protein YndB with AHSA1/START domain
MTHVSNRSAGEVHSEVDSGNATEKTEAPAAGAVELSIFIEARPQTIFSILSDPDRLGAWMNGQASFQSSAGSPFSIAFPQFDTTVAGEVVEIVPNKRVAFTWGVAGGPQAEILPAGSTNVEFTLRPEADGTRLTLTHSGLEDEEERTKHEAGWRFHGSRLSLLANRADLRALLDGLTSAYFDAWNERDAEARASLLEACCVEDVEFKDEYAAFEGREKLSLHIGGTQFHLPGTLELDGEVSICRGELLLPWKHVNEDGEAVYRGTNHAAVTPRGMIRRVTGFWAG